MLILISVKKRTLPLKPQSSVSSGKWGCTAVLRFKTKYLNILNILYSCFGPEQISSVLVVLLLTVLSLGFVHMSETVELQTMVRNHEIAAYS